MHRRLRVVFFGRSDYFASTFLQAISAAHDVVGVVEARPGQTAPPGRARSWFDFLRGRGSLRLFAQRQGLPYRYLPSAKVDALDGFIETVRADAASIASFPRLLPASIFELFPLGVLNYHPSLLPAYRGPLPLLWQYFHQEQSMGVTVHLIDAREDTGDIVAQQMLPVSLGEPIGAVEKRFARAGASLMRDALSALSGNTVVRTPQSHLPCPFRARLLRSKERLVDWETWSLERTYHFLRGAAPSFEQTPQPGFPFDIVDWRPAAFERTAMASLPPGTVGRSGWRFFIQHRDGRIWLHPHADLTFLRRSLRRRRTLKATPEPAPVSHPSVPPLR